MARYSLINKRFLLFLFLISSVRKSDGENKIWFVSLKQKHCFVKMFCICTIDIIGTFDCTSLPGKDFCASDQNRKFFGLIKLSCFKKKWPELNFWIIASQCPTKSACYPSDCGSLNGECKHCNSGNPDRNSDTNNQCLLMIKLIRINFK